MIQHPSWWLFVTILPFIYWRLPMAGRPILLAATSFITLLMLAPFDLFLMLTLSIFVYVVHAPAFAAAGKPYGCIRRTVTRSSSSVILILAYLLWAKYTPPLLQLFAHNAPVPAIAIPLGISYFSFKLIHYALERSRGMLPAHSLRDFLSWLFLMPTFASGPIERFEHFVEHRETRFRIAFLVEGGTRIAQGLVKKFALTPPLEGWSFELTGGDWSGFVYGIGGVHGMAVSWAYLALELAMSYLDFSAYSDIAIGASRLFGLRIMENFNYPLLSTSLPEFWRRYHMSLTNWCRAYIYMPMLGYTRNPYLALIGTFTVVGLWHAGSLNWLIWGVWHGCGQGVAIRWGRFAQRKRITFFKTNGGRCAGWALTIGYVMLGCALEAVHGEGTVMDALHLMARAFGA